jgi:DNA-binding IclR family transcriptional regulator
LLAAGTDEGVRRYLKQLKPERLTASTETDKRRLADVIAKAREAGVAQTVDQASDGVIGTAAAIRDATGTAIGALIVAAPSSRQQRSVAELANLTLEHATAISRSLGYRPPSAR